MPDSSLLSIQSSTLSSIQMKNKLGQKNRKSCNTLLLYVYEAYLIFSYDVTKESISQEHIFNIYLSCCFHYIGPDSSQYLLII